MQQASPKNEHGYGEDETPRATVTALTPTTQTLGGLLHDLSQPLSSISINTALISKIVEPLVEAHPELGVMLRDLDRDVRRTREVLSESKKLFLASAETTEMRSCGALSPARGRD